MTGLHLPVKPLLDPLGQITCTLGKNHIKAFAPGQISVLYNTISHTKKKKKEKERNTKMMEM